MWSYFLFGLAAGVLLAIPLAVFWGRRTERRVRQLERRARSAERLAELGTLTGGLAHEIKNPLSTVGLNLQLLDEDLRGVADHTDAEPQVREQIGRMRRRFDALRRETDRLRQILEDFLRFAGRVKLELAPTDINRLVDELVDFYAAQAQHAHVNLRTQLTTDPAIVQADAALLKQAVLNLMINATQAMSSARDKREAHGGANELIIRTERARVLGRDELHLHVTDTGPGMTAEVSAKVFQPYFSTKPGGSGLGLPTSRRIVEEHGGQLTVHSDPGRGSDFVIHLPIEATRQPVSAS